jgi:hypothetical protein
MDDRYIRVIRRLLPAGRADAVQVDLVILRDETGRGQTLFIERTSVYFKEPVAGSALEVMVMFLPGPFIENTAFRRKNLLQPSVFDQDLQVSINGGLIQGSDVPPADLQDFVDSKRPVNFPEDFLDCIPLTRFSLHSNAPIRVFNEVPLRLSRGSIESLPYQFTVTEEAS